MITQLAQYIVGILIDEEIIDRKKLDIHIYGFEIIISSLINIVVAIVLGLAFWQFWELIIFLAVFIPMRQYSGGYHANTYVKCNIAFSINLILAMSVLKLNFDYNIYLHLCICILTIMICVILSPIKNSNKPLSVNQKKKYKIISIIICLFWCLLSSLLYYRITRISLIIDIALLSVILSMCIEILKKGGNSNEKHKNSYLESCCEGK